MIFDSELDYRLQNLLQVDFQSEFFIDIFEHVVKMNIRLEIMIYCSSAMLSL